MTERAENRPFNPEPPPYGLLIAVLLEICFVALFIIQRSYVALLLCCAYFWFSASCSLLFPPKDPQ